MSSYENSFAYLYDRLTDDIDYKSGSDFISGFFKENGIEQGTILDLGCGTCSISSYLGKNGYCIIGVDASADMLQIASQKLNDSGCDFSLINAKMQDLPFTGSVDGCISTLDSLNHLDSADDIADVFAATYASLCDGGLFIFDMNTIYKHDNILADNTFIFDEEDYYLVWDNELVAPHRVRILIDLFCYNGSSYDRYSEEFCEQAYDIDLIADLLRNTGFVNVAMYSDFDRTPPQNDSERIFFVCKKE